MNTLHQNCPCKRTNCRNHGNCAACKERHHGKEREIPTACEKIELKAQREAAKKERKNRTSPER